MYREKSKKQAQTQHLYDTLKKRVMTSQVQTAASDSVAQAIHSMSSIARPQTLGDPPFQPLPQRNFCPDNQRSDGQYQQPQHSRSPSQSNRNARGETGAVVMPPPPGPPVGHHHPRRSYVPGQTDPLTLSDGFVSSTPQHRTHLPGTVSSSATRSQIPLSTRAQGPAPRQPLANIASNRNHQTGSSGYGITAGMKVGRPHRSSLSNNSEQRSDGPNGSSPDFSPTN